MKRVAYGNISPRQISVDMLNAFPTAGVVNAGIYIVLGCAVPARVSCLISQIGLKKHIREKEHE